jgi:hypothetical protein
VGEAPKEIIGSGEKSRKSNKKATCPGNGRVALDA